MKLNLTKNILDRFYTTLYLRKSLFCNTLQAIFEWMKSWTNHIFWLVIQKADFINILYNIQLSFMPNNFKTLIILCVIFIVCLTTDRECKTGQVKIHQNCIKCQAFPNTLLDYRYIEENNKCLCTQQFQWSEIKQQCVPIQDNKTGVVLSNVNDSQNILIYQSSRLMQQSCDTTKGFILSNSVCVNCRVIPFGLGSAVDGQVCNCAPSFQQSTICSCAYSNYIDAKVQKCIPCSYYTFSTGFSVTSCIKCNTLPFVYSNIGCINCLTLANNGGTASCCATGYKFDSTLAMCICDKSKGYSVGANNFCSACASGDTNCKNGVNNYLYNGFYNVHGSLIPNYNTNGNACNTGYSTKKDFYSGRIISCACSASGYYQNGASCVQCSVTLPKSVSLSNCKSCAQTSGFYRGTNQCIYCPGVSYSLGTATINGCECLPNYYWNLNTDKCQCDFAIGLVGGAIATCINCTNIPYTDNAVLPSVCSCVDGYKWDTATNTCICDFSSPSVFVSGGVCFDCAIIEGSIGTVANDKASCNCIGMFIWNYGLNKCQCDSIQNYAVFHGECNDCSHNPSTFGIAYNQQCLCKNGYTWDQTAGNCICPDNSVLSGIKCISCSAVTLPSGVTTNDCLSCTSQAFTVQDGVCVLCSDQSNTATKGSCSCPPKMVLMSSVGGCVCDWSSGHVTKVTDSKGAYTCSLGSYTWGDGSYACGWSFLLFGANDKVCTDTRSDPNGAVDSKGVFSCKSGFTWSEELFPFRCIPGGHAGKYYAKGVSGASPTYSLCSSLSGSALQQACTNCDYTQGFLLLPAKNICVYCPNVPGASTDPATTTQSSCACKTGYWNPFTINCDSKTTCSLGFLYNPSTEKCDICDAIYSVFIGETCTPCKGDPNSDGYAASTTSCRCKTSFTWNGAKCSSSGCSSTTSIIVDGTCFTCPSTNGGTGKPNGTSECGCNNGHTWKPTATGGSCVCNSVTSTSLSNGTCFTCPNNANTTGKVNPEGGCLCNSNYVWDGLKAISCICDSTVNGFITDSGLCFRCLSSVDAKFDGTIINGSCNCKNNFAFIATDTGGSCTCTSPSVVTTSGSCLTCPSNDNTTGSAKSSQCLCYNNFIWSAKLNTCICDQTVFAFITGSGFCFQCLTSFDPNFDTTIINGGCNCKNKFVFTPTNVNGSCKCQAPNSVFNGLCQLCPINLNTTGNNDQNGGCQCKNNYVWVQAQRICLCDTSVQAYVTSSGACFQCIQSTDPYFDGSIVNGKCNCISGFTFVGNSSGGACSCLPTTTSFVLSNGICFKCPTDSKTAGTPDGKGGCKCKGNLAWDSALLVCSCVGSNTVTLSNGKCFTCGSKDSYTNSKKSSTNACQCVSPTLTWNSAIGLCDCGKSSAMIIKGSSYVCVTCNSAIRAKSKLDTFSCKCTNPTVLVWNKLTSQCDCGLSAVYFGSKCVPCGPAINANGLNILNPSTCTCILPIMIWNSKTGSCFCNSSQVIFTKAGGSVSCVSCDLTINAKSKNTQTACYCHPLFKWVPNTGCACINSTAIITVIGTTPKCLSCNLDTYSSGPAADGKSCTCLGQLIWNSKTLSCGCNSGSAIANNGTYFCAACASKIFAKTPVISLTACTCGSSVVKWYNQGYCACPDIETSVVVGSGSSLTCVKCDSQIFSNGKTSPSSNTCSCVNPILKYNNGICDCGSGKALILKGLTNFQCVTCNNATAYMKAKISPKQCSCLSSALVWNNITGVCCCSDSNQIVIKSGAQANCSGCTGQYATFPKTIKTCQCMGTGLVYVLVKDKIGYCACPKFQILTPTFSCQPCPNSNTITTPYECTCGKNSFWNGFNYTCQSCSSISNAKSTGGNIFACACISGFIWDVMTLACIATGCSGNACMNCNIPYADGTTAATSTSNSGLTDSSKMVPFLNATFTNYNSINLLMCTCIPGFKWDAKRLRCFDQNLI